MDKMKRYILYIGVAIGCMISEMAVAAGPVRTTAFGMMDDPLVDDKMTDDTASVKTDGLSKSSDKIMTDEFVQGTEGDVEMKKESPNSYFELRAGYQIGGTVPFPLPAQMRAINGFHPKGNFSVQAIGNIPIGQRWEMAIAAKFERKGMTALANVKDYGMSIEDEDGGIIKGRWTGDVEMTADQWFLTMPITGSFYITEVGRIRFGFFFSFLTKGKFSGEVSNGYLREGDPTGAKIEVDDKPQSFDFSDQMKRFQWGFTLGGEWRIHKRLMAFVDLDWGLKDIFVDEFETITFDMFPIYGTVGLGYAFH